MAVAINITPILDEVNDLCSADKANIASAIYEEYVEAAPFAANHTIETDVRAGSLIPLIDAAPDYGFMKVSQGNCNMNECDITTESSAKKWNPVDYNCRLIICKDDLDCDFRKFWNMRCKDFDNMEDAFMQFLVERVNVNFNASQWRIGYFDTSTNTDTDYAGIDGLFHQWLALAPVGAPNRFVIPENAEATIADQLDLAPDRAYTLFRQMWLWASVSNTSLFSQPNLRFEVTPELAYNYLAYLQDNKEINCCESATDGITSSRYNIAGLNYLGIPIVIREEWRQIIQWQQQQSGAANLPNPHRAVLTYRDNKVIGTCDQEAFRNFDMFYDRKDRKIYIDIATSMDAKVLVNQGFALAI